MKPVYQVLPEPIVHLQVHLNSIATSNTTCSAYPNSNIRLLALGNARLQATFNNVDEPGHVRQIIVKAERDSYAPTKS